MKDDVRPKWWPLWEAYKAAQREYEAAVDGLAGVGPQASAGWTMERIRSELMPKRNAAFDAFRAMYVQR